MTIKCEFRPNGVIVWHSGVISAKELFQTNTEIYSHNYLEGLQFQLIELSEVIEFNVSSEDMNRLADMDINMEKDRKQFACVVAPSDLLFGLARIWNTQSEDSDFETNVVHSMDEAISWFESKDIHIKI